MDYIENKIVFKKSFKPFYLSNSNKVPSIMS